MSRPLTRWRGALLALACCGAFAASAPPVLPGFDDGVAAAIAPRLAQPLDLDGAVRIALLQHPAARAHWLELGLTPRQAWQAGLLDARPFDPWRELLTPQTEPDHELAAAFAELLRLAREAKSAWYRAAAATEQAKLLEDARLAADAQAELARARRSAGNLSRLDEAEALAEAIGARLEAEEQQREAVKAQETLRAALGLAPDAQLALTALPVPASTDALTPDALERRAIEHRPELRAALRTLRLDRTATDLGALRRGAATLPLLGRQNPRGHRDNELDQRLAAETALYALRHQLAAARLDLDAAWQRWQGLHVHLLPQRATVVAEALKHYNGMLKGVDKLIEARGAELAARREEVTARLAYWQARLDLDALVGDSLPPAALATPAPAPTPAHGAH